MSLLKEDVSKYTNAGISKFAVAIASLTATRPDAVQKFADTNNLNIEKLYQFLKKSKLDGKMNFVSALVGKDGNPIQKKMIKMFQESVNEEQDHEVKMAQNSLDSIIKYATELKQKMGEMEKDVPAWIQSYITMADEYISQASSNYHEYGSGMNEGKLNEMDRQLNVKVNKMLQRELGDLTKGGPNHQFAIMYILQGALTDANFHSTSRKVPSLFPRAKYEGDPMAEKDLIQMYEYEIGPNIAALAKWDGKDIVDAIGFYVSMTIGRPMGEKIEKLVEGKADLKESKLTKILTEGLGPSQSTITKITDALKKELGVSNVKAKKYSQGRARQGYTFYPDGTTNGLYIDEAYDGTWEIYTVNAAGFPKTNHWQMSKYKNADDIEDESVALQAALDLIKKFGKTDLK